MRPLTKREKFLIIVLIALLIGSAYAFLFWLPMQTTITASKAQLSALKEQHTAMDETLALDGTLDDDLADAKQKADTQLTYILKTQDNEEISNEIVQMARTSGLSIESVAVSDPAVSQVDTVQSTDAAAAPAATAAADGTTTGNPSAAGSYPLRDYLYQLFGEDASSSTQDNTVLDEIYLEKNQVTLTCRGTLRSYMAFLDSIKNQYRSMRVVSTGSEKKALTTELEKASTTITTNEDGTQTETTNDAVTQTDYYTLYTIVVDIYSTEGLK